MISELNNNSAPVDRREVDSQPDSQQEFFSSLGMSVVDVEVSHVAEK
jgi:hypothetical protein